VIFLRRRLSVLRLHLGLLQRRSVFRGRSWFAAPLPFFPTRFLSGTAVLRETSPLFFFFTTDKVRASGTWDFAGSLRSPLPPPLSQFDAVLPTAPTFSWFTSSLPLLPHHAVNGTSFVVPRARCPHFFPRLLRAPPLSSWLVLAALSFPPLFRNF